MNVMLAIDGAPWGIDEASGNWVSGKLKWIPILIIKTI